MKYFLAFLALGMFPAPGQPTNVAPIGVFTHFQKPTSPAVSQAIQQEVERIIGPLGIPLVWKSLDTVSSHDIVTELAVVKFNGNCQTAELIPVGRIVNPLGITHVSDGIVLPFTDIDCSTIRDFLRKPLLQTSGEQRDALFGRAVGRVLAHELFHIFAKTAHHGTAGVGKPAFTETELVSDEFELEPSEFRMLRASLRQARKQNSRLRKVASSFSGRFVFRESGCAQCHGISGEGTKNGPALRSGSKSLDAKTLASELSNNMAAMYARSKHVRASAPTLDEDEIADIAKFLSDLN